MRRKKKIYAITVAALTMLSGVGPRAFAAVPPGPEATVPPGEAGYEDADQKAEEKSDSEKTESTPPSEEIEEADSGMETPKPTETTEESSEERTDTPEKTVESGPEEVPESDQETPEPTEAVSTETLSPTEELEPTTTETPSPTEELKPTITETPSPTEESEPAITETPSPTEEPEPVITETPSPTEKPEPATTETPSPAEGPEPTTTEASNPTEQPDPTITETPSSPEITKKPDPIEDKTKEEDEKAITVAAPTEKAEPAVKPELTKTVEPTKKSEPTGKVQKDTEDNKKDDTDKKTEKSKPIADVPKYTFDETGQIPSAIEQQNTNVPQNTNVREVIREVEPKTKNIGEELTTGMSAKVQEMRNTDAGKEEQKTAPPEIRVDGVRNRATSQSPVDLSVHVKADENAATDIRAVIKDTESGRIIEGKATKNQEGYQVTFPKVSDDGHYQMTVQTTDAHGKVSSEKKVAFTVNQHGGAAYLATENLAGAKVNRPVSPEFVVADVDENAGIRATVNGRQVGTSYNKEGKLVLDQAITKEGRYVVRVEGKDSAGHEIKSKPVEFVIDKTKPRVWMKTKQTSKGLVVEVFHDVPEDRIESVMIDGKILDIKEYTDKDGKNRFTLDKEGAHTVKVTVKDAAGNKTERTQTFRASAQHHARKKSGHLKTLWIVLTACAVGAALACGFIFWRLVRH